MKLLLTPIFLLFFVFCYSQPNLSSNKFIKGEVYSKNISTDSIFFINGEIDEMYYEIPVLPSKLSNNTFKISNQLSYPHMYRIVFKSDKNNILYRSGVVFIDSLTTMININYLKEECIEVDGFTTNEFYNQFIPSVTKNNYKCDSEEIYNLSSSKASAFDSLLFSYVKNNSNSFVALWYLIERFEMFGHSIIRQQTLETFSEKIKQSNIWQLLSKDMIKAKLKINEKFPAIFIRDTTLHFQKLILPSTDYILVDFWWSRCKPCLESFPALLKLYDLYKKRSFEIIGVSIDKEKDIQQWKQRISQYNLSWTQYIDFNSNESNKLSLNYFPTNFLLDKEGKILVRDITTKDLEEFLMKNRSLKIN